MQYVKGCLCERWQSPPSPSWRSAHSPVLGRVHPWPQTPHPQTGLLLGPSLRPQPTGGPASSNGDASGDLSAVLLPVSLLGPQGGLLPRHPPLLLLNPHPPSPNVSLESRPGAQLLSLPCLQQVPGRKALLAGGVPSPQVPTWTAAKSLIPSHPGRCQAPSPVCTPAPDSAPPPPASALLLSHHGLLMTQTSGANLSSACYQPRDLKQVTSLLWVSVSPRVNCTRNPGPQPPGQTLWDLALTTRCCPALPSSHYERLCSGLGGPGLRAKLVQGLAHS